MSLSSPAAADQSPDETPNAGKPEKKSREGNVGVGQPLHVLVVEQPTRRRDKGFMEGLHASGSRIAAVFGNTPSEVEVCPKVKERRRRRTCSASSASSTLYFHSDMRSTFTFCLTS